MKFARILILLLLIHGILPQSSYAEPDVPDVPAVPEAPNAATLAWDTLTVVTGEKSGEVWLRIKVVGAGAGENVNLKFIYQTFRQQATPNDDYYPTPWPGNRASITGLQRYADVRIGIINNSPYYLEPYETFEVELRSDASNTTITGPARATVRIQPGRIHQPVVGQIQSCTNFSEPSNNSPITAGPIVDSGGWCSNDFLGEAVQAFDYYSFMPLTNGTIKIRLENTTPNQHDLDLYLFYRDGNGNYQNYRQSINGNQQAEYIEAPLAAYTNFLIGVHWVSRSGDKVPTYRVSLSR
ncbi:hypothetical protein [Herpetosiphon llansteffanensis]|uniref:hypothetical protein n=1 Tax=Herpetosiphon llansteffanensis TaxID=2094568 RepID=UPI000D7CBB37|nr:hypothetical protein [Herpetosiphon llansteffanensis]